MKRRVLLTLLAGASVWLSGCGIALERSRASDKFRAVFGCSPERVQSNGSGYRVEGCGVTAYLQCFDDDRDHDDELTHLLLQGDDTCMIEHSERRPMPTLAAEAKPRVSERNGEKKLRVSFAVLGAQITLLAAPKRDRERLVVLVRPLNAQMKQCDRAALWIEGEPVTLEGLRETRNRRGHEIQFAIPRARLDHVADALRVSLSVCGTEIEIDDAGKKALGLFEIQFREQLSQLEAS